LPDDTVTRPGASAAVSGRLAKYARDLETLPGDIRLLYRRGGWREVREAVADRTFHRLYRAGRLLVIAQDLDRIREVPPPAGVLIRRLDDGDWPGLATLVPARDLDRFRRIVAGGHTCLLAWRGREPVGYTWLARRLAPEVTMFPLPLPPTAAYLWDVYVPPAERSTGIGSALVAARLRRARDAGFREGWRIIAPSNRPSLRTVDKTAGNGRVVGEIRFVKVLSRLFAHYEPTPDGRPVSR
jgi:GNAT superfamily N-acetyltransferase